MSYVNRPRHPKMCHFYQDEWDWLQKEAIESNTNMMEVIHRVLKNYIQTGAAIPRPVDVGRPIPTEEEILAEHMENLMVVPDGNNEEILFRYDKIFCPYVNGLPISDAQKQSLLEKGKQMTIDYLDQSKTYKETR